MIGKGGVLCSIEPGADPHEAASFLHWLAGSGSKMPVTADVLGTHVVVAASPAPTLITEIEKTAAEIKAAIDKRSPA